MVKVKEVFIIQKDATDILRVLVIEDVDAGDVAGVGINPNEIAHPVLGNQACDLVSGVPVGIYKKTAAAGVPDVGNEQVHEERRLADATHAFQIYMLGAVDKKVAVVLVSADWNVHSLKTWGLISFIFRRCFRVWLASHRLWGNEQWIAPFH